MAITEPNELKFDMKCSLAQPDIFSNLSADSVKKSYILNSPIDQTFGQTYRETLLGNTFDRSRSLPWPCFRGIFLRQKFEFLGLLKSRTPEQGPSLPFWLDLMASVGKCNSWPSVDARWPHHVFNCWFYYHVDGVWSKASDAHIDYNSTAQNYFEI